MFEVPIDGKLYPFIHVLIKKFALANPQDFIVKKITFYIFNQVISEFPISVLEHVCNQNHATYLFVFIVF